MGITLQNMTLCPNPKYDHLPWLCEKKLKGIGSSFSVVFKTQHKAYEVAEIIVSGHISFNLGCGFGYVSATDEYKVLVFHLDNKMIGFRHPICVGR